MLKFLVGACLILCTAYLSAQTLSGQVIEQKSEEPLIGATVVLKGTSRGTITNLDGQFTLVDVKSGDYTLEVSFLGFEKYSEKISVSRDVNLGIIYLEESTVGLQEVEVFADVVEERKTPVAISTISAQQLDERYGNVSLAEAVNNTPGVYTIQGAGGFGDQEVYIRGFDQTNVAFLVNGIPVNDMENGRMFWSNFAGLNQVTRTTQVQRGLGASKLAISSIGGTVNMITKPSDRSKGGRIEYMNGTGTWNNRVRLTYNTGLSDNGWAFSFQGTRTTTTGARDGLLAQEQGSILPGAFVDAWSYYVSASKKINDKHQLMFWAFGAPFNRGSSFTPNDLTREVFNIDEPFFNDALGFRDGQLFNARQNRVHKPLTALTHYWDIDENTNITTSIYYSNAKVESTQPRDAEGTPFYPNADINSTEFDDVRAIINNSDDPFARDGIRGFFPIRLPWMIDRFFDSNGYILWDNLEALNRENDRFVTVNFPNGDPNVPSVSGYASRYFIESRHNNHNWIGLVSNYTKQISTLRIRAGVDARYYRGEHFATVDDLLGGDFILNVDEINGVYNKLDGENAVAFLGDKTNYHYDGVVNWMSGFAQAEWIKNNFIFFGSAALTYSDMQRIGYFWYGRQDSDEEFNLSSLGKSEKKTFLTYTLKTGVNYKITGRHNVYANFGYFTRPPFLRNSFFDARYSNEYRTGLTEERVTSTEIGYGFRAPFLKVNINAYYMLWTDRTTEFNLESNGDIQVRAVPLALTGLVSEHKGIEFDFVANPYPTLELNGFISLGDWIWKDAPVQDIRQTDGTIITLNAKERLSGLPVGTAAQTTMGVGLHYTGIRSTYMGGRLNYADRIPIRYLPEDILSNFISREVIEDGFNDYATVDIYLGRYIDLGDDLDGRISFNVNNVFDTEYVRFASFFQNQTARGFGFTRTYMIGLSLNF